MIKKVREYPHDMPEDTIRYLQSEERKQTQHIKIAQSKANVRDTVIHMHQVLGRAAGRGTQLQVVEEQIEDLMNQSEDFYYETMPGWKRYALSWAPPRWWFPIWLQKWCCRKNKKNEVSC